MIAMEELCTACLCSGRFLFQVEGSELHQLYVQILNEVSISAGMLSACLQVCWECKALLRRLLRFKNQAQQCYKDLLDYNISQRKSNLVKPQNLQVHSAHLISYPECEVKVEEELTIKDEVSEDNEMHCEPETFVNDLVVDNSVVDKKEKKTTKRKSKQRVKIKKKKQEQKVAASGDPECLQSEVETKKEEEQKLFEETCHQEESEVKEVENADQAPAGRRAARSRELLPEKPQCGECGKLFSSRKTYRYHLNVLHKGQNRYPCPRCGKVYQWKSNLGRHMRSHKARDSGELHCRACDKRFASVATYRQHLRVSRRHARDADFRFMCADCGQRFLSRTRLRDHVDWDHLHKVKFRCTLCDKPFKCHTSLYVHMQNVHRNKEKKENLCHVCGKSYQNAAKLKYHIVAMHTSETPYSCEQCSAAFGWYSSLYRHVREVHYKMKVQPKKNKKAKKQEPSEPAAAD